MGLAVTESKLFANFYGNIWNFHFDSNNGNGAKFVKIKPEWNK